MNPTKEEIEAAIDELRAALLDHLDLQSQEQEIKVKTIAAQKRLAMARENVRALTLGI